MVEDFFGFRGNPFGACPDDEYFVPGPSVPQAQADLAAAARAGQGVALLTGPPGVGKTIVCHRLAQELRAEFDVAVLSGSGCVTRRSLLQSILYELQAPHAGVFEQEARLELISLARESVADGRGVVLIVDEAHELPPRLLEGLRSLTNYIEQGRPLVRLVLAGTLQLEEVLIRSEMEALNQRIVCHVSMEPLRREESARHLAACLAEVGGVLQETISAPALELICHASDGVLRCLHRLSERCLERACEIRERPLSAKTVRMAYGDLQQLPLQWNSLPVDDLLPIEDSEQGPMNADQSDMTDNSETAATSSRAPEPVLTPDCVLGDSPAATASWTSPVASFEVGGPEEPVADALPSETAGLAHSQKSVCSENVQKPEEDSHVDDNLQPECEADDQVPCPVSGFLESPVRDRYARLDRLAEQANAMRSDSPTKTTLAADLRGQADSRRHEATPESRSGRPSVPRGTETDADVDEIESPLVREGSSPDEIIDRVMSVLGGLSRSSDDHPFLLGFPEANIQAASDLDDDGLDEDDLTSSPEDTGWMAKDWQVTRSQPGAGTGGEPVGGLRSSRVASVPPEYDIIEPPSEEHDLLEDQANEADFVDSTMAGELHTDPQATEPVPVETQSAIGERPDGPQEPRP